jgi:hypothetical protein
LSLDDLRAPADRDLPALLALNNAHAAELSLLDHHALQRLLAASCRARVIGSVAAFIVAFDETSDYASPNYRWFRSRHRRFVYVDRVCVSPEMRGRGLARRLYDDVFAAARAAGHKRIVCEVNRDPPNPGSDAFHAALGFAEAGTGAGGGGRVVRYLERAL